MLQYIRLLIINAISNILAIKHLKALSLQITYSVATGSGHPDHQGQSGHILPGSTGSDPLYKISGSDRIWCRITCVIIMTSRGDDVLNHVSISCQYISKRIIVDGVEAPRKITRQLYGLTWLVQQQSWQSLRSQTI